MRYPLFFLTLLSFGISLNAQTKGELVECLRLALADPEMEQAFLQEWGGQRPLYLRQREAPGLWAGQETDYLINLLTTDDFQGLPWEVIPATEELIRNLPLEEQQFGVLEIGLNYQPGQMLLTLYVSLARMPRRWLNGTFLLTGNGDSWQVSKRKVEHSPGTR